MGKNARPGPLLVLMLACSFDLTKTTLGDDSAQERHERSRGLIRVACSGDSITFGDGTQPLIDIKHNPVTGGRHHERGSYPQLLQRILEDARPGIFQVGMFAVGGCTAMFSEHLTAGRHSCHQDLNNAKGCAFRDTWAFEAARHFHPHVNVLMLGTNDAKDLPEDLHTHIQEDIRWLMRSLTEAMPHAFRQHNNWLLLPPRVYQNRFHIAPAVLEDDVWPLLDQEAKAESWGIVDLRLHLDQNQTANFGHHKPTRKSFFPAVNIFGSRTRPSDGVHPQVAGSLEMAREVAKVLIARYDSGALRLSPARSIHPAATWASN